MNIVFLDDAAERLPPGALSRRNYWPEWDARIPIFQKLLRTFVADFRRAEGEQPVANASLYALEVSATASATERDRQIVELLTAIEQVTGRATFVLARSTAGSDQLRLVCVSPAVCSPHAATGFLAALAEVSPPVFHGRIGERFGPFRKPPTIVFDPRFDALTPVSAEKKASHRWGLLEGDTYLLPHYVLHAVAVVQDDPIAFTTNSWADRSVELGQKFDVLTNMLDRANVLQSLGQYKQAQDMRTGAATMYLGLMAAHGSDNARTVCREAP